MYHYKCLYDVNHHIYVVLRIRLRYLMVSKAVIMQALLLDNIHTRCNIFIDFTVKCSVVAFTEHTT